MSLKRWTLLKKKNYCWSQNQIFPDAVDFTKDNKSRKKKWINGVFYIALRFPRKCKGKINALLQIDRAITEVHRRLSCQKDFPRGERYTASITFSMCWSMADENRLLASQRGRSVLSANKATRQHIISANTYFKLANNNVTMKLEKKECIFEAWIRINVEKKYSDDTYR